ncbi:MAG: hypothetical protein LBS50_06485 [Prevotellaceae bacterium]|jgi:hypothetical protein|nr:hypothetical protein [Prevotellaceae bacterium]
MQIVTIENGTLKYLFGRSDENPNGSRPLFFPAQLIFFPAQPFFPERLLKQN